MDTPISCAELAMCNFGFCSTECGHTGTHSPNIHCTVYRNRWKSHPVLSISRISQNRGAEGALEGKTRRLALWEKMDSIQFAEDSCSV